MSLIQDALKRQVEEQAGHTYTPPPIVKRPSGGGAFGKIVAMLFALVLLVGTAGALFYLATKKWSWKDAVSAASSDLSKAEQKLATMKTGGKSGTEPPAPQTSQSPSPFANVQLKVGKMKVAVEDYKHDTAGAFDAEPAAPAPVAAAAPKTAPPKTEPPAQPVAVSKKDDGISHERAKAPSGTPWPSVTLNGIMSAGSANGAALLNNRMVGAGESVEGARLIEVQAKGVILEYEGETRLVLIGQTTE